MPGMSGLEFGRRLRSQQKTETILAVFYSGQWTADLKAQAIQAGVSSVLEEPFPLQEFLDLVRQLCNNGEVTLKMMRILSAGR